MKGMRMLHVQMRPSTVLKGCALATYIFATIYVLYTADAHAQEQHQGQGKQILDDFSSRGDIRVEFLRSRTAQKPQKSCHTDLNLALFLLCIIIYPNGKLYWINPSLFGLLRRKDRCKVPRGD